MKEMMLWISLFLIEASSYLIYPRLWSLHWLEVTFEAYYWKMCRCREWCWRQWTLCAGGGGNRQGRAGCDRPPSEVLQSSQSMSAFSTAVLICLWALHRQQTRCLQQGGIPHLSWSIWCVCLFISCLYQNKRVNPASSIQNTWGLIFHSVIESRDWITHVSNIARMGIVNICKQNTEIINNMKQMLNIVLFGCFHWARL